MAETEIPEARLCTFCAHEVFGRENWRKAWAKSNQQSSIQARKPILDLFQGERELRDIVAASRLCWLCHFLVEDHRAKRLGPSPKIVRIFIYFCGSPDTEPRKLSTLTIYYTNFTQEEGPFYAGGDLEVSVLEHENADSIFPGRLHQLRKWVNFDSSIATHWIERCQTDHPNCLKGCKRIKTLPTRVLDVHTQSNEGKVLLLETTGVTNEDYAALSYVWGNSGNLTTTKKTKPQRLKGFSEKLLPQTVRDAIEVTRSLKMKYLWVDALCIIQDSEEDRVLEFGHMRNYYKHAHVTIAASRAGSVNEGFLQSAVEVETDISLPTPEENARRRLLVYSALDKPGFVVLDKNHTWYDPIQDPLHRRSWTAQEFMLSRRVLHFPSAGGFALQCRQQETCHGHLWYRDHPFSLPEYSRVSEQLNGASSSPNQVRLAVDSWQDIIHNYGGRQITYPKDKLIAIAALAEEYHHQASGGLGHYYAGHWKCSFDDSLEWEVPSEFRCHAPEEFRAPSWSWASVDGAQYVMKKTVRPHETKPRPLIKVVSIETHLKAASLPFGAVKGGHLRVACSSITITWLPVSNERTACHLNDSRFVGTASPDATEHVPATCEQVLFMPLRFRNEQNGFMGQSDLTGLLLRKCPIDASVHQRIGFARLTKHLDEVGKSLPGTEKLITII